MNERDWLREARQMMDSDNGAVPTVRHLIAIRDHYVHKLIKKDDSYRELLKQTCDVMQGHGCR